MNDLEEKEGFNMFIELARKRRSIRRYRNRPLEPEKIDLVLEAAVRAPSSRGTNPWEFIMVQNRTLIQKLARAKKQGASFAAGAQLVIVVCADTEKSDVWIEDASIASTMILLAAQSLDLGACWIQIRKRQHDDSVSAEAYVRDTLALPERFSVLAFVAIGYPEESKPPHPQSELSYGQVHSNRYGTPWRKPPDGLDDG
jgi:nitroreductase